MLAVSRRTAIGGVAALAAAAASRPALSCNPNFLRVGIEAFPPTLDPMAVRDLVASRVLSSMYEGLTRVDDAGRLAPALAESWNSPDGGSTWLFSIRRGVRFHTGRLLRAADIKKTFEAVLTAPGAPSFAVPGLAQVEGRDKLAENGGRLSGVEAPDDHTLVVRLTAPTSIFPFYKFLVADLDHAERNGADWFTHGSAGTGPYRFDSWVPGSQIEMKAHSGWWGGTPDYDRVSYVTTGGREASIEFFNTALVDLVLVDPDLVKKAIDGKGFQRNLASCPRVQTRFVALSQANYAPFRDPRVRRAMSMAINRRGVVERFFRGMAADHHGVVPPFVLPGDHLAPLEYDPARAAALLADAGHPEGEGMPSFVVATIPDHRQEFSYYVSQWNNLGIPATLSVVPKNEYNARWKRGDYVAYHVGWTGVYPDAMNILGELFSSGSPFNRFEWNNNGFEALLAEALATTDSDARNVTYRKAERMLMDDFPVIPLPVPEYVALRCAARSERCLSPYGGLLVR